MNRLRFWITACLAATGILEANPGGHWSFDGGTPGEAINRVEDETPAGKPLVAIPGENPPTYTLGILGDTAAAFDGNQALEIPDGTELFDFRTDNTAMAWVQIEQGKGGVIWQMGFRPRVFNPDLSFNFGITTKAMWIDFEGRLRIQRAGGRTGATELGGGLRIDDGTPHHVAHVIEPQKSVDIETPFDCNGDMDIDMDIDMDDVDGDMNPCVVIEQDVVDLSTVFIDGVQLNQGQDIEARRSKALGSFWIGKGAEGEIIPIDDDQDGVQDESDLGELKFRHADVFPFARCDTAGGPGGDCSTGALADVQAAAPFILQEVGMEGVIDEIKFFRGGLNAEEIRAEAENLAPDCTGKANTTVTGVGLIQAPSHRETAVYSFEALGTSDPDGDEILYFWKAVRTAGNPFTEDDRSYVLQHGPAPNKSSIDMFLPAGTYEMEVTVDDSVRCPDAPGGDGAIHFARSAPVVIKPFTGFPEFRTGAEGNGNQIYYDFSKWFDRSPDDDTYWETVTGSNTAVGGDYTFRHGGGGGRLTFLFDVSVVGGGAGTWHLWTRMINPQNASDFGSIEGDPDDILDLDITPAGPPWPGRGSAHPLGAHTFTNDDRVFEFNAGPTYVWSLRSITVGEGTGGTEGHIKELRDGLNTHYFFNRQGAPVQKVDILCWTDDAFFTASDETLRRSMDLASCSCAFFSRGDGNGDARVNIADASFIANFVFGIAPAFHPPCEDAADANGDGATNIADISFVANFVFGVPPATPPPAPGPRCGAVSSSSLVLGCTTPPALCN